MPQVRIDWDNYIPHRLCNTVIEGIDASICMNCQKYFWYNEAQRRGMSKEDARDLIEGRTNGGGGSQPDSLEFLDKTAPSAPTDTV